MVIIINEMEIRDVSVVDVRKDALEKQTNVLFHITLEITRPREVAVHYCYMSMYKHIKTGKLTYIIDSLYKLNRIYQNSGGFALDNATLTADEQYVLGKELQEHEVVNHALQTLIQNQDTKSVLAEEEEEEEEGRE